MSELKKTNKQHRLLRRQLKKSNFSQEQIEEMSDFLASVDKAYRNSDKSHAHLENIIEQSSQELFKANKTLELDVAVKDQEIHQAKIQLNRIVENIGDIVFETDVEGYYTYLNSAWEESTGVPVKDSIGKHFTGFLGNVGQEYLDELQNLEYKKHGSLRKIFPITKDNHTKWMETRIQVLQDEDGNPRGYAGSLRDISSIKEAEFKLIKANKVKDEFLSAMSHEIRTPLNAVIGMSNMLILDNPKPEQINTLNALKFSSEHLLNLVNDILDVNKLRAGKLELREEEVDLKETLSGLRDSFGYNAETKGLKLIFDIDDQIPSCVIGDQLRISQVLTNLVGNAIKFSHEGSVKLTCKLLDERAGYAKLFFEVTDTGIGISDDKLDLIFEKFTQADIDTAKKYGGSGLGLTLCKGFLDQYGSKLVVTSKLGKGSKFSFTLDLKIAVQCQEALNKTKSENKESIKGLNVLIVEDNELNIMVLENYFNLWEVKYDVTKNGQEALDKVKSNVYDLILMDLRMPVMDGYEATKQIRSLESKEHKETPIIALSASVSNDVVGRVKSIGMNDYLVKPFDPEDLIEKISMYGLRDLFTHNKTFPKKEVPKIDEAKS